jgi:hypothetical protein
VQRNKIKKKREGQSKSVLPGRAKCETQKMHNFAQVVGADQAALAVFGGSRAAEMQSASLWNALCDQLGRCLGKQHSLFQEQILLALSLAEFNIKTKTKKPRLIVKTAGA